MNLSIQNTVVVLSAHEDFIQAIPLLEKEAKHRLWFVEVGFVVAADNAFSLTFKDPERVMGRSPQGQQLLMSEDADWHEEIMRSELFQHALLEKLELVDDFNLIITSRDLETVAEILFDKCVSIRHCW